MVVSMDAVFRKLRRRSDPWHFCQGCSRWPMSGYVGSFEPPTDGAAVCPECVAKHAMGTCKADCQVISIALERQA